MDGLDAFDKMFLKTVPPHSVWPQATPEAQAH